MPLNKRDIVNRIAGKRALRRADILAVVQDTLDTIKKELLSGGNVELRKFGVFEVKTMKARIGRNPRNPSKDIVIPERKVVKFRASKELKDAVGD